MKVLGYSLFFMEALLHCSYNEVTLDATLCCSETEILSGSEQCGTWEGAGCGAVSGSEQVPDPHHQSLPAPGTPPPPLWF